MDFPGSPVRVSTTVAAVQQAVEQVAPERIGAPTGGLFLSAVDGDATRVGRRFLSLYGPGALRLAVTTDEDELVRRTLRHLSLPLWVAEETQLWWTGLRTLIGPEGAVLFSWRTLGSRPGLLRALERAGYEIVDSLLTAIDPESNEVVVHPGRFDPERGELSAAEAGAARRLRVATIALGPTDYMALNPGPPEFFTKALAVSVEPTAAADHRAVLEAATAMVDDAQRVILGGSTIRELVDALDGSG